MEVVLGVGEPFVDFEDVDREVELDRLLLEIVFVDEVGIFALLDQFSCLQLFLYF